MTIWHNGAFKDDDIVWSIHDRVRLGEGVFNTMLVIDGKIYHAEKHFSKLLKNSEIFLGNWDKPTPDALHETARALLHKNGFSKGRYAFNTFITGGPAGNGIRASDAPQPQILMRALPLQISDAPVHALIATTTRRNEGSPLSNIKCCHYGDNILALKEVQQKGASEALMLNNKDHITCASTANILYIENNHLYTPPLSDGCQEGVTRGLAMQKFGVKEKSLKHDQLHTVQGLYLLNSLRGAVPVVSLETRPLGAPPLHIERDFHLHA